MFSVPMVPTDHCREVASARRNWPRRLLRSAVKLLASYLLIVALMMWFETLLIFPTWQIPDGDWHPTDFVFEEVYLASEDGTQLCGWYFPHPEAQLHVVYYHGNGEDLSHLGEYLDRLRTRYQLSVFAIDYRGYGRSQGKPHEAGVLADGRAAQQWLARRTGLPTDQIVLWGRSIGGAVAVQAAADQGAQALILERTFTSLPDVAAPRYFWLPVRPFMRNRFDSLSRITDFTGPLLQSHGTDDEIVPFQLGRQLFLASPSQHKQFVAMRGVSHNAPNSEEYYTELSQFLTSIKRPQAGGEASK